MLTRKAIKRARDQERKYKEEDRMALSLSWYCDRCAVEVYDRTCPHCGKTKRQRT